MAIKVIKVGEVSGTNIVALRRAGDFAAILTNFENVSQPAEECNWQIALVLGEREVMINLAQFISSSDYIRSNTEPIFFSAERGTLVFFRGRFFLPERPICTEAEARSYFAG
jgi:hypothetical protein